MTAPHVEGAETNFPAFKMTAYVHSSLCMAVLHLSTRSPTLQLEFSFRLFYGSVGRLGMMISWAWGMLSSTSGALSNTVRSVLTVAAVSQRSTPCLRPMSAYVRVRVVKAGRCGAPSNCTTEVMD